MIDALRTPHLGWRYATLILVAALLTYQLYHIFYAPVWLDDAFFGIVAKSLAAGRGYECVLYDKAYLFHYGITAGPVLILPAALMISVFGNQHWVLGLTVFLLIWGVLLGIVHASKGTLKQAQKWRYYFMALLMALLLTAGDSYNFSIENSDRFALWFLMMGEVISSLLVIFAVFILFAEPLNYQRMIQGGLLLGSAILTKTITTIAVCVCIGMVGIAALLTVQKRKTQIMLCLTCICAALVPIFCFELFKIGVMGWGDYLSMQVQSIAYYKQLALVLPQSGNNAAEKHGPDILLQLATLMSLTGIFTSVLCVAMAIYIGLTSLKKLRKQKWLEPTELIQYTLILCFLVHFVWWVLFALPGLERYIVNGLMYFSAGAALLLASPQDSKRKKELILLFFMALCIENYSNVGYLFYSGYNASGLLQEQLEFKNTIQELERQHVALYSCSSDARMEYLLPGRGHFKDCSELPSEPSASRSALYIYYIEPGKIYRNNPAGHSTPHVEYLSKDILAQCDQVILSSEKESLRWCNLSK